MTALKRQIAPTVPEADFLPLALESIRHTGEFSSHNLDTKTALRLLTLVQNQENRKFTPYKAFSAYFMMNGSEKAWRIVGET